MKRSTLLYTSGALFVIAVVGCQAIAGIQSRTADPLLTGCNLPGVAGTALTGNGKIRVVNLGTNSATGNADFCVRASGTTSWGRPIFRDGGNDSLCAVGLKYQESTVPFSVPAGKIDVRAIPAGQTCSATPTSEIDGVAIGDTTTAPNGVAPPPVTIVRWGNASTEKLSALAEHPGELTPNSSEFRIVNALASSVPINVGTAASAFVPTTLTSVGYSTPIAPGGVEPGGAYELGTVDAEGYLGIIPGSFLFGASLASDTANNAIVVFSTPGSPDTATLYVGGDPADPTHPAEGLYCEDAVSLQTAITAGIVDAGAGAGTDAGVPLTAQDNTLLAQCTPTRPPLISVDTFNVGLYGANAPFETDRRPAIYAAIAARTSDVMCVVEADNQTDQAAIASAATAWYPYTYSVATDLDTPPTLASDVRTPPTVAPCDPSVVPAATITNIYNCVNTNCSTNPGDPTFSGTLDQSTDCLENSCAQQFLPIYEKSKAVNGCFDCIVLYLTSEQKISAGQTACTTDTHQPFAFIGQTPSMILSHYPLSNQHAYILPATGFRRAVLQATVTLENNQQFDFFCAQLTSPLIDQSLPYVGYYGQDNPNATPPENGWEDEQDLQVGEVIAFIQSQSKTDGLPAILAGDWHATNGQGADAGVGALGSLSPEVMNALESPDSGLVEAIPPGYVPTCDYCPDPPNPLNTGTVPLKFLTPFLAGFPTGLTQTNVLWGTANTVTIVGSTYEPPPAGGVGPLAETYPSNITVLRPPTH